MTMRGEPSADRRSPVSPRLTHARLLGARLYLHTYVRLIVAVTIVFGALFARYALGIKELNVTAMLVLAALIAAYNAVAWFISRGYRTPRSDREPDPGADSLLLRTMYAGIVLDFVALTAAIWLVGGARSPFLAFYLLHVMLSCILLSRRAALTFIVLAYVLLVAFVLAEWLHLLPQPPSVAVIGEEGPLPWRFAIAVIAVYSMLFALTGFLLLTLSHLLRRGEQELYRANAELDRLSSLRRDFLHIALHNLQSPVGAATMMLSNLRDGLAGPITDKQSDLVQRSIQRLDGLSEFMHDLQMLSTLESGRIDTQMARIDLVRMVSDLVDEYRDLAEARGHTLIIDLPPRLPEVVGVERLLREAIVNYLTNAIKYTPEGGRITIHAASNGSSVRVDVEDTGPGIAPEDQRTLFQEFVRLGDGDRRASKVKGTGLGLSIVRRVIEAHGGRVLVESEPGRGSTFSLELPVAGSAIPTDSANDR